MKESHEKHPNKAVIDPKTGKPLPKEGIEEFQRKVRLLPINELMTIASDLNAIKSAQKDVVTKKFMYFLLDLYNDEIKRRTDLN